MGLSEQVVTAVLADWRTAPVDERMRGALALVEKLTLRPEAMSVDDIAVAHAAGLTDNAIRELGGVVFCFSVMVRLADAFDFAIPNAEEAEATGDFLHSNGYKLVKLLR